MKTKQKTKTITIFALTITIMIILTIILFPYIKKLTNEETRLQFQNFLNSLGIIGWLLIILIQLIQMIIAFLPGEIIELLTGAMYGPWLGLLTCLIGTTIGSSIIFFLTKKIGMPFVKLFTNETDLKKYKFLNTQTKLDTTIFILFFIPGTPKDALTYIVPFTNIKFTRFIIISSIARIPSIITSTIIGDQIINGNYSTTIIVFIITAIISLLGIIISNKYIQKKNNNQ